MIYALKLLVLVLLTASVAYFVARPAFAHLLTRQAYFNAWRGIILAAFVAYLSRYPWVFVIGVALVAMVTAHWLGGDLRARIAAWLMLILVFPPVSVSVGGVAGINRLLVFDHFRVLAVVLLAPAFATLMFRRRGREGHPFLWVDMFVIAYQVLSLVQNVPFSSFTGLLRLGVASVLDVLLPYYVLTRGLRSLADIRFVATHLVLGCVFVAAVAMLEVSIQRNVYAPLQYVYDVIWQLSHTLMRGGLVRVQSTTPQPILLACDMIVALGLWTWLSGANWRRINTFAVYLMFLATLAATFSRGPWLCCGLFFVCLLALRWTPPRVFAVGLVTAIIGGIWLKASGGDEFVISILQRMFGSDRVDFASIEYRQRLLDIALGLIKQSPLLGVPNYLAYMQDLKQGEGIIDLVNMYLLVTLNSGLLGLLIYLMPLVITLRKLLAKAEKARSNPAVKRFTSPLIATQIAISTVLLTTASFSALPFLIIFMLTASLVYVRLSAEELTNEAPAPFDVAPKRRHGVLTLSQTGAR